MDTKFHCAFCTNPMPQPSLENAHLLVDNYVYKCGELSYIEIAHRECAPHWISTSSTKKKG